MYYVKTQSEGHQTMQSNLHYELKGLHRMQWRKRILEIVWWKGECKCDEQLQLGMNEWTT